MNRNSSTSQVRSCLYQFQNIPPDFRAYERMVLWRKGPVNDKGKFAKIPLNPQSLQASNPHNPANWLSFDSAVNAYEQGRCNGIGLALTGQPDAQGRYLTCIDLDADVTSEQAEALYYQLGKPWAERSPSGNGFHFWMWSRVPLKSGNAGNGRELYQSRQFVTLTGVDATGQLVDATEALEELHKDWFGFVVRSPSSIGIEGVKRDHVRPVDATMRSLAGMPTETSEAISRVKELLAAVDPDTSYEQWRNVVWSVLSTGWDCAEELAREWSEGCHDRYDLDAFNRVVNSFDPDRGIGLGTLIYHAEKAGLPATTSAQSLSALIGAPNGSSLASSHKDVRNGQAYATQWRGKLVYVTNRKAWLRWDEGRWQLCEKGEEVSAAKAVAGRLVSEAQAELQTNPALGKQLMQHAVDTHNAHRLEAMIKLAKDEGGMSVTEAELDSNPTLLGVANGVVNLRTGALMPNSPELYITMHCNADYHPAKVIDCPRWLQFLDEVFIGATSTIEAVQRLLGYTLTGLSIEEVLVVAHGFGANGKSVFGNVVHHIMGGYSSVAASSLLVARGANDTGPRDDLAALVGARHVSINELQAGDKLDERTVKVLAGREPISARRLYGNSFTFMPTFTPWLRTNHKPIIQGTDDGIWRRLVLLPFQRQFSEGEKDPWLEQKLLAERDGILAWMIEGAIRYLKDGLNPSVAMRAELSTYRNDSDLLAVFLEECTEAAQGNKVKQQDLYTAWKGWCTDNGISYGAKASFTRRLSEKGYPEQKSNGTRSYAGLKLRAIIFLANPQP